MGQIRDLPKSFGDNLGHSCYKNLMECEFWGPVVAQCKALHGADALDRFNQGFLGFHNNSNDLSDWADAAVRNQISKDNVLFLSLVSDLYRIASTQAGGAAMVDTSKQLNHGLALFLTKELTVTVIHLIRDPRAVTAS